MREAGFVRVTRSGDRGQAMAAMRECAEAIAHGVNVWIAPEGTRSPDGKLGKFKKGGFMLARDTGTAIVPIAIDGSRAILPKNTGMIQKGARVRVIFGTPIPVTGSDTNALMSQVRMFIATHVTEPQA
jgi:1-acyl-sn-glycerol-3-phosphate acyltransferase